MRTRIKYCGVMNARDARLAADCGADAVGMIVHAKSKRFIELPSVIEIAAALPPYVAAVGVFVNATADRVREVVAAASLSAAQLHGDETPHFARACGVRVIKSLRVDDEIEHELDIWRSAFENGAMSNLSALLLESAVAGQSGGTGVANDFARIAALKASGAFDGLPPIVLSGGLTTANVTAAVALTRPYAIDVSSGIETAVGQKSAEKMRAIAAAVAHCDGASAARS